jgi:hypothetical protein
VGLVVLLLGGSLFTGVWDAPRAWLQERWRDLATDSQQITEVKATGLPPGSVAKQYDEGNVVDDDPVTAWATAWPEGHPEATKCGGARGIGRLRLTWSGPTRVDKIKVFAGRSTDDRAYQFVPSRIDFELDGRCVPMTLNREEGWQTLELSVAAKVTEVTVGVAKVYANEAEPPEPIVAISGIRLLTKPD